MTNENLLITTIERDGLKKLEYLFEKGIVSVKKDLTKLFSLLLQTSQLDVEEYLIKTIGESNDFGYLDFMTVQNLVSEFGKRDRIDILARTVARDEKSLQKRMEIVFHLISRGFYSFSSETMNKAVIDLMKIDPEQLDKVLNSMTEHITKGRLETPINWILNHQELLEDKRVFDHFITDLLYAVRLNNENYVFNGEIKTILSLIKTLAEKYPKFMKEGNTVQRIQNQLDLLYIPWNEFKGELILYFVVLGYKMNILRNLEFVKYLKEKNLLKKYRIDYVTIYDEEVGLTITKINSTFYVSLEGVNFEFTKGGSDYSLQSFVEYLYCKYGMNDETKLATIISNLEKMGINLKHLTK